MARIRTQQVTEREVEQLLNLDPGEAIREGKYYLAEIKRYGQDFPFYLRLPTRLNLSEPNVLLNPLMSFNDIGGSLNRALGHRFNDCLLTSALFRVIPGEKRDDLPVYQAIDIQTNETPTLLVVKAMWPLGHPPVQDLDLNGELVKSLQAVACHRDPVDDGSRYGIDTWFFDVSRWGFTTLDSILAEHHRVRQVLEMSWSVFELQRPYYRHAIEKVAQKIDRDYLSIGMGEDFVTVIVFKDDESRRPDQERESVISAKIWYDSDGLEFMQGLAKACIVQDAVNLLREIGQYHSGDGTIIVTL